MLVILNEVKGLPREMTVSVPSAFSNILLNNRRRPLRPPYLVCPA